MEYLINVFGNECMENISEQVRKDKILGDLVTCINCGNNLHVEGNMPDYEEVGGNGGKIVSIAAAECKAKYRYEGDRDSCGVEAGIKCNASPYHHFMTCEEYEEYSSVAKCRFGDNPISDLKTSGIKGNQICCFSVECTKLFQMSCNKKLDCGHFGYGSNKSGSHMPCLHPDGVKKNDDATLGQTENDLCTICGVPLKDEPCVYLAGNHIFHERCLKLLLNKKWSTAHINFSYLNCAVGKSELKTDHEDIIALIQEDRKFEVEVTGMAVEAAEREGMQKDDYSGDPYNGSFELYAASKMAIYQCFDCKKPYQGGKKECGEFHDGKPDELLCQSCTLIKLGPVKGISNCEIHGTEFLQYKCRFCGSVAVWFGWGDTHFGDSCHTRQNNDEKIDEKTPEELPQCKGIKDCPLNIKHPKNGTDEYSLWGQIGKP